MLFGIVRRNTNKNLQADDPESVIVTAARRLDAGKFPITQVGIQFIQVRFINFGKLQGFNSL